MKKVPLFILLLLVCAKPLFSSPMDALDEQNIQRKLIQLNIDDKHVDLNVRVSVPEIAGVAGADLWATVIRSEDGLKRPSILMATPYRREMMTMLYAPLVSHGYNLISIDIRGTGSSGGSWVSFSSEEHRDIAYVIDRWIPEQSWSDGTVGMIGPSYCAIIQVLAAGQVEQDNETGEPVHLKAIMPFLTISDAYRDIVMQGGSLNNAFIPMWMEGIGESSVRMPLLFIDALLSLDPLLFQETFEILKEHFEQLDVSKGWLMDMDLLVDGDFYDKRSPMIYWPDKPETSWGGAEDNIIPSKLPVFMVGGWFDLFTRGTLNNYEYGLKDHADPDKVLVVGPWYHFQGSIGQGIEGFLDQSIAARWFDWKIKGVPDPFLEEFPVLLYVMGEGKWRAEKMWPLSETRVEDKRYYLSETKPVMQVDDWFSYLNLENNYLLSDNASSVSGSADSPSLIHNPLFLHGNISRSSIRWGGGSSSSYDGDGEDERFDELGVITFTTDPLSEDMEIAGPLLLSFCARTQFIQDSVDSFLDLIKLLWFGDNKFMLEQVDVQDVQWVVELNDVFPDGRARNITSGWLRASHRPYDPDDKYQVDPLYVPFDPFYAFPDKYPDLIEEEKLYSYAVELWPTDNVFKTGHRIRVSISASDYPHLIPVLRPFVSTLMIDDAHPAYLDFKITRSEGEGLDWEWIDDIDLYLSKK